MEYLWMYMYTMLKSVHTTINFTDFIYDGILEE